MGDLRSGLRCLPAFCSGRQLGIRPGMLVMLVLDLTSAGENPAGVLMRVEVLEVFTVP